MKTNVLSVSSYPLTLSEFTQWLKSKNSDDIIGIACDACTCPISMKLIEQSGGCDTEVLSYRTLHNNLIYENPDWVKEFINLLDDDDKYPNIAITARKALEIIETFCFCTVCNSSNKEGNNCGRDDCPW